MGTILSGLSGKTRSVCKTVRVGIEKTVSVASFFKKKVSDVSWEEFGKFRSYLWKNKNVSYLKGVFSPYAHYLPWNKQGEEGEARGEKTYLDPKTISLHDPQVVQKEEEIVAESLFFKEPFKGKVGTSVFDAFMEEGGLFLKESELGAVAEYLKNEGQLDGEFETLIKQALLLRGQVDAIESREGIEAVSKMLCEKVAKLQEGEKTLVFGRLAGTKLEFAEILKLAGEQKKGELLEAFLKEMDPTALSKLVGGALQGKELEGFFREKERAETLLRGAWEKFRAELQHRSPEQWVEAIIESLQEDLRELVCGKRGEEVKIISNIFDETLKSSLDEAIQKSVGEVIMKYRDLFEDSVQKSALAVADGFPEMAGDFLAAQGVLPKRDTPYWLEIIKEKGETFTLKLYGGGKSSDLFPEKEEPNKGVGIGIPLIFKDVPKEKISERFFYHLLVYEQKGEKTPGVLFYSFFHLIEMMKEWFENASPAVEAPYIPHFLGESTGPLSLFHLFSFHRKNMDPIAYRKWIYDVRLGLFLKLWSQKDKKELLTDAKMEQRFKTALVKLKEDVVLFLQPNKGISDGEIERFYVTEKEASATLQQLQGDPQDKKKAKEWMNLQSLGISFESLEVIREVLAPILGEEGFEVFDQATRELEETYGDTVVDEKLPSFHFPFDWKKWKSEWTIDRVSLLTAAKTFLKISATVSLIYRYRFFARLYENLINTRFPALKEHFPYGPYICGWVIAVYGIDAKIAKQVLPKKGYQTAEACYRLLSEIPEYVGKRISIQCMKAALHFFLPQKAKDQVRSSVLELQSFITKEGTLDFSLPKKGGAGPVGMVKISRKGGGEVSKGCVILDPTKLPLFTTSFLEELGGYQEESQPITPTNLLGHLESWATFFEKWRQYGFRSKELAIFLNQKVRLLEVPKWQADDFWQKVPNKDMLKVMEQLHLLANLVQNQMERMKGDARYEGVISFYTLYAAVDALARRCPEAYLDDSMKPSGADLVYYIQCYRKVILRRESIKQLRALATYFGFELSRPYTKDDISAMRYGALFNFFSEGSSFRPTIASAHTKITSAQFSQQKRRYKRVEQGTPAYWLTLAILDGMSDMPRIEISDEIVMTGFWAQFSQDSSYYYSLLQKDEIRQVLKNNGIDLNKNERNPKALFFLFCDFAPAPTPKQLAQFKLPNPLSFTSTHHSKRNEQWDHAKTNGSLYESFFSEKKHVCLKAISQKKGVEKIAKEPIEGRKGILPRPFYLLRYLNVLGGLTIYKEEHDPSEPEFSAYEDRSNVGLRFTVINEKEEGSIWNLWNVPSQFFHSMTGEYLKEQKATCSMNFFQLQNRVDRSIILQTDSSRIEGSIHGLGPDQQMRSSLRINPFKREQQSIVEETQSTWGLEKELARLSMMVGYDLRSQMVRTLSFFHNQLDLLASANGRSFFEHYLFDLTALEAQRDDRPLSSEVASFFKRAVSYHRARNDLSTTLYLIYKGIEMEKYFQSDQKGQRTDFPDYRKMLREEIIPSIQQLPLHEKECQFLSGSDPFRVDGMFVALSTLAFSYLDERIEEWEAQKKLQGAFDLARFAFYQRKPGADFYQMPLYEKAMEAAIQSMGAVEALFSDGGGDELLNTLFDDCDLPHDRNEKWVGGFPRFDKGELSVRLDRFVKRLRTYESINLEEIEKIYLKNRLHIEGNQERWVQEDGTVYYPAHGLTVSWQEGTLIPTVEIEIEGEKAQFLRSEEYSLDLADQGIKIEEGDWVFQGKEALYLYKDKTPFARFILGKEEGEACTLQAVHYRKEGQWLQKVDLKERGHFLHILDWVTKVKEFEAYETLDGSRLAFFVCHDVSLSFRVDQERRAWVCNEEMQGYFLSSKQEDPFLAPYPDAWRLESEGGGVMVLLKVYPFNQLAAHFGGKRFGSFLKGASFDRLFRMGIDHFYPQNKGELYSYIMDEKGELSSSDPEKTAYLLLYHYCMGNRERAKTILEKLEDQGNTLPFTEEVHQNIDRILPFLIVDNSTFSIEIALKCAALQEKNSSVQEGGANRKFQQASMEIFRWIVLQQKYIQYLNHIEGEGEEFLSPMQELFILRSLSQFMVHYFKTEFLKLEEHGKLSSIINYVGIDALAIHFGMMPRLVKRFGILEAKYVENSGLLTGLKLLFSEDFFEDAQLLEGGYLPKGKRGAEAKVSTLFREIVNNPLLVGAFSANSLTIKKGNRAIQELPVEAEKITPEHLKEDFLSYYALAKGETPKWGIWKEDFKKKAALFQKNLPLLQGGFKKEIALYYQILLVTAKAGLSHYMPWQVSAQKVEKKIEQPIGLAIFMPPEEQTRAEGKRIFREAAVKQCEAYAWKYGKEYALPMMKEMGKEYAITTAQAYLLGPLSVVTNYTYIKEQVERIKKHKWELNGAMYLWSGAKKIHGLYQKVREVKQGEGKLELRPMVDMQQKALAGWEKLLNGAMIALLKDYFDWEWKEVKDKPAQEILDGYEDPLKEFYAREAAQAFSATLKEGKSEEAFLEAVNGFKKEIEKAMLDAEEAIVSFAALPREKVNRPAIERLKNPSNPVHRKEIEFKEILSSFLKGRYHDLLKKSTLKEKDLPLLEQKLFCYLVLSTRCLQLFRVMEKGNSDQIAEELARQRNYTFEENVSAQIIKGHLAVEYGTKTQMRAVQATQVAAITTKQRVVERAQMGIGKSTRIIPESSYIGADGETLMMNIWPKTVLRQNVMIAAQMGREAFRQGVDGLSFTMGPHWTSAKLSSLYSVLKSSIAERGQINWSEEDTIAIELSFIEYALDLTGKLKKAGDYWPKLTALRDILRLIRFQGRANIDEFHMTTQVNKVTNRPQGVKKAVKKGDARWIARTALALISSDLGKKWVTIKDASPKSLPKETFEKEIAPGLATMMADDLELGVSPNHRKSVSKGLGRGDVLPEECEKVQNEEALYMIRGMITHLLPLALEEIPDENYGESSDPDCEYVKPSEGNKNTLEQAEFISPYETVLKTCLFYLYKRLKNHQLEKLCHYCYEEAYVQSLQTGKSIDQTEMGLKFGQWCPGVLLSSFKEANPSVKKEIYATLKKSDEATLLYVVEFISPTITYYPFVVGSNGLNCISMFHSYMGHTGTPDRYLFPERTEFVEQKGTLGESLDTFMKKVEEVSVLNSDDPKQVLEEIIEQQFAKDPNLLALIDRGNALLGLSTDDVAERLFRYIQEKRPDLKGVAFFRKDALMILDETGVKPFHESKIKPHERITYYDGPHTYAANADQAKKKKAVVTLGEKTMFREEMDQAKWRMRGLLTLGQSLKVVMTPYVARLIVKEGVPSKDELIAFMRKNEKKAFKQRHFTSVGQKGENLFRRAVLDQGLSLDKIKDTRYLIRANQSYVLTETTVDPKALYGGITKKVAPDTVIQAMKDKWIAELKGLEDILSDEQISYIEEEINALGEGAFPDEVSIKQVGEELVIGDDSQYGQTAISQVTANVDVEAQEVEQAQQTQTQTQTQSLQENQQVVPRDIGNYSFNPETIQIETEFRKLQEIFKDAEREECSAIADALPSNIYGSWNLFKFPDIDPFGPKQKPLFDLIVYKKGDVTSLILVDQKEGHLWRERLKWSHTLQGECKVEISMIDLTTRACVARGRQEAFYSDAMTTRAIAILKFLSGEVDYADDERILLTNFLKKDREKFNRLETHFHSVSYKHHKKKAFEGSDLQEIIRNVKASLHTQTTSKTEFCQSERPRFNPIEAAPIQLDRCNAEGVKSGNAHKGKNRLLKWFGF